MSKWLPFILIIIFLNLALYLLIPKTPQITPITELVEATDTLTDAQKQAHDTYKLGSHFVIGYTDFDELKDLVKNGAIGGIFLTTKNVKNKAQLRSDIQELQNLQKANNLPPLYIATDQEGGSVERLSPPLTSLPPLSSLINQTNCTDTPGSCFTEEERAKVKEYAVTQGSELHDLGINLNFAPVVDVYQGIQLKNDKYTHLNTRALSQFPWLVAEISKIYVKVMFDYGITPTLKHFPGLGSATKDSHLTSLHLTNSLSEFEKLDWIPFKEVIKDDQPAIMLSHSVLDALDPTTPSSYSGPVINYLRNNLGFTGLIVTDDFSMNPIKNSKDGIKGASIKALAAGVDLILISSPDQYPVPENATISPSDPQLPTSSSLP